CRLFQSAAEPKEHACRACPLLPTKITRGTGADADNDAEFIDNVQRLVMERSSGFGLSPSDISPLEAELIITWDATVAAYERAHQARVAALFETLLVRG